MTIDEKLQEMAEYYDQELDHLHATNNSLREGLEALRAELDALKKLIVEGAINGN